MLVAAATVTLAGAAFPAAAAPAVPGAVAGRYVVTVSGDPHGVAGAVTAKPTHVYDHAIHGFAASLTGGQLVALRADPRVRAIEPDAPVHAYAADWGLDRIDQRALPLNGSYNPVAGGSGTTAYVIDTGIAVSHPDFGGRAAVAYDALGGNGIDCNGHGTHVAGIVGGTAHGVAKLTQLRSVRVLDCAGSGSTSGVIAGVDWVAAHHLAKSVANLSLGGGFSSALNTAVTNLANSGVFVAVAAGGSNSDACNVSPASAAGVAAAAASDSTDTKASSSNYGSCVDLYAPGVAITSDWPGGGTNTLSGTSMSSGFVTGAGALYKSVYGDAASSTVLSWIVNRATAGVVKGNPSGTPNRLLYVGP
jgi:subtilisin family serine protease